MTDKAAIYARVCVEDGHNLAEQMEACRSYARDCGLQIVAEFADAGQGSNGATPAPYQLNRALELARAGGFEVLVVRDAYRLSRSLANLMDVEEELQSHGVRIDYVLHKDSDNSTRRLVRDYVRYLEERASRRRGLKHHYLLGGRVRCGRCGHQMRGRAIHRNGEQGRQCYLYYRCELHRRPKYERSCDMPPFRADRVDAVVWNWFAHSIQQTYPDIGENLTMLSDDFETRRQIVDMLNVQVTLSVEDGQKVVYVQSILDETSCKVVPAQP